MADIVERHDSRGGSFGEDTAEYELKFGVMFEDDDLNTRALVEATIPPTFRNLQLRTYKIDPVGGGVWNVSAKYEYKSLLSFEFDTTGGKQKIKQCFNATSYVPSGKPITDFKRAINVQKDGKVEGVEIHIPKFSFCVKRLVPHPLPQSLQDAIRGNNAIVNDSIVTVNIQGVTYTLQVGELIFTGATGGYHGGKYWDITLKFEVSDNEDNLTVGDITGIVKAGWDYLSVIYREAVDPTSHTKVMVPVQVDVCEVYDRGNLNLLLGNPPPPTNLTATVPGAGFVANLTWTASYGATSYNIYRGNATGTAMNAPPLVAGIIGTAYSDTTIGFADTKYYQVTAVAGGNESGPSDEARATNA